MKIIFPMSLFIRRRLFSDEFYNTNAALLGRRPLWSMNVLPQWNPIPLLADLYFSFVSPAQMLSLYTKSSQRKIFGTSLDPSSLEERRVWATGSGTYPTATRIDSHAINLD